MRKTRWYRKLNRKQRKAIIERRNALKKLKEVKK